MRLEALENLGFGVTHGGELGLTQPFGFQDLRANQGEGVHDMPPLRQPRSLLPRLASQLG